MAQENPLFKEDLYKLLDVEQDADTKTIRKAYRQMAKTCHPDKNPDDKHAAEKFHKLSEALKILVDSDLRTQYDVKRKARERQKVVFNEMNKFRQSAKQNLEEREAMFKAQKEQKQEQENKAKNLREEAAHILAEEMRIMREEILREKKIQAEKEKILRTQESQAFRLKIKFNPNTLDATSVTEIINQAFKSGASSKRHADKPPYIALSKKSGKSEGIIETEDFEAARDLVRNQIDEDNLLISWYETPIPSAPENAAFLEKYERDFFTLEANVLAGLRKRSRIE